MMRWGLAALAVTTSVIGCKQPPAKLPEAIPAAMDTDNVPSANKKLPTSRRLDIKLQTVFEGIGAQWVAGDEPWYSVGPEQKLWQWDKFEPKKVAERIYIRHQFHTTTDPDVLTVGLRRLARSEAGWAFDDATRAPLDLGEGYEASEAMLSKDLSTLAVSAHWRAPRGLRVDDGQGGHTYSYKRPNKPSGPDNYVVVVDAKSGAELYRRDGRGISFAETPTHLGFIITSNVVLLDRKTWTETEIPVPGIVGRLSLTSRYFAVAGGGDIASLFELSDTSWTEVGRWAINRDDDGVAVIELHPTEPIVAVSGSKTAKVDVWIPHESVEKPAFTVDGLSHAHFHPGGEHLIAFAREKNATHIFSLF